MTKAFVDTTVLVDAILKVGESQKTAKKAIRQFDVSELPVYAIKEFKAGPLKKFAWFHDKLVQTKSYEKALAALQSLSGTLHKYITSTSIEALRSAQHSFGPKTPAELTQKYGETATMESIITDQYRIDIHNKILRAWKKRRQITTNVTQPLSCYTEVNPFIDKNGYFEFRPYQCEVEDCCLSPQLKAKPDDLKKLTEAIGTESARTEDRRRYQALKDLYRKPKRSLSPIACKNLGDAMFAFFAPDGSIILTTNIRDHEPLATVLGKKVQKP